MVVVLSLVAGTSLTPAQLYGEAAQGGEAVAGVPPVLLLIAWLVLAVVGAITQFAMTRVRAAAPPPPPAPRDRW